MNLVAIQSRIRKAEAFINLNTEIACFAIIWKYSSRNNVQWIESTATLLLMAPVLLAKIP